MKGKSRSTTNLAMSFMKNLKGKLDERGYKDVKINSMAIKHKWENLGVVEDEYPKLFYNDMCVHVWDTVRWHDVYYMASYSGTTVDVEFARDVIACIDLICQETGRNIEIGIEFVPKVKED